MLSKIILLSRYLIRSFIYGTATVKITDHTCSFESLSFHVGAIFTLEQEKTEEKYSAFNLKVNAFNAFNSGRLSTVSVDAISSEHKYCLYYNFICVIALWSVFHHYLKEDLDFPYNTFIFISYQMHLLTDTSCMLETNTSYNRSSSLYRQSLLQNI